MAVHTRTVYFEPVNLRTRCPVVTGGPEPTTLGRVHERAKVVPAFPGVGFKIPNMNMQLNDSIQAECDPTGQQVQYVKPRVSTGADPAHVTRQHQSGGLFTITQTDFTCQFSCQLLCKSDITKGQSSRNLTTIQTQSTS